MKFIFQQYWLVLTIRHIHITIQLAIANCSQTIRNYAKYYTSIYITNKFISHRDLPTTQLSTERSVGTFVCVPTCVDIGTHTEKRCLHTGTASIRVLWSHTGILFILSTYVCIFYNDGTSIVVTNNIPVKRTQMVITMKNVPTEKECHGCLN